MHALVDCDIFCYELGSALGEDNLPLEWNLIEWRLDNKIENILDATQASSWTGFLTGPGNFREQVATILPYKGQRNREGRPFWYQGIYNYLKSMPNMVVAIGREADDEIADRHDTRNTVCCSRDKDFRQLEGWHYSWPGYKQDERRPYYINRTDALRFIYYQMLVGDSADNILGLYGVGDKSAIVAALYELDHESDMSELVRTQYHKRFGGRYGDLFFEENMKLLKIGSD